MARNIQPCFNLRNIPENKIQYLKDKVISNCEICSVSKLIQCNQCHLKSQLLNRYYEANIPLDFLSRTMKDFKGDKRLISIYDSIVNDIETNIQEGFAYLLKGMHGVGKTYFASMLLKRFVEKEYKGLYTVLTDIVSTLVHSDYSTKQLANIELRKTDLLIIDEFDPRFFGNDASAELYGRILESILRIRLQNKMPTILITNNPNPTASLGADLGMAISSLIAGYMLEVPVIGPDFRKQQQQQQNKKQ